jgi:hypothetical protein
MSKPPKQKEKFNELEKCTKVFEFGWHQLVPGATTIILNP